MADQTIVIAALPRKEHAGGYPPPSKWNIGPDSASPTESVPVPVPSFRPGVLRAGPTVKQGHFSPTESQLAPCGRGRGQRQAAPRRGGRTGVPKLGKIRHTSGLGSLTRDIVP
jgi:hypothetical protein